MWRDAGTPPAIMAPWRTAFGTLVWVVAAVGAIVAIYTLIGTGRSYREIGGGGTRRRRRRRRRRTDERRRRARHGDPRRCSRRATRGACAAARRRWTSETELAALDPPAPTAVDDELREEIRQHVLARNARRVRAGSAPLDVDAEIERRIRELS